MSGRGSLPELIVTSDGSPLSTAEARALGEVRVRQRLSLPTQCELAFFDPESDPGMGPGSALRLEVKNAPEPLFVGEVTAVEHLYGPSGAREVRVRGYDLLHRLRKRQSVRAHVQLTPRELAVELVADLRLSVWAAEPGPLRQRLVQHRQSDLELLAHVAEDCGLYLALRGDVLHLLTLDGIGGALPLTLGEELLEARLEVSGEPACRAVQTSAWDPLRAEEIFAEAVGARGGRRVGIEVAPARVGGDGRRTLAGEAAPDDPHAAALAQAELDRRVAREVVLWGVAEGDPRLRPGTPVEVAGVGDSVAGRYVLTGVTHTVDTRKGFVSEISTAPPPPRERAGGAVATLGRVTRVDDPEAAGRVQVALPAYGGLETEWLQVLSVGAGNGKGLTAVPDVDDRVLVLFPQESPDLGIVLGGLYGMEGPSDPGIADRRVRRFTLLTPGGQRLRLDDERQTLRLEDASGSYLELSPERVRLHAAVDLELEAPGRSVVVRGERIDFERG